MWGGNALPLMMYDRATVPRKRWSSQGEVEKYFDDGVGFRKVETHSAIEYLKSANLVSQFYEDGYERLTVDEGLQRYIKEQARDLDLLMSRSLMLMCHLFPGNKEMEPLYVVLSVDLCTMH